MTMRTRLVALTAALVLAPAVAAASSSIVSTPSGEPVSMQQFAPGSTRTSPLTLSNPTRRPAEVALSVAITADEENGCLRQEVQEGDLTCEADEGELGRWLQVTIDHEGTELWSGTMLDLADPVTLTEDLPGGEDLDVDLTVSMPGETGNETMTDRVAFDLRVSMRTAVGNDTEVLGVDATANGPGSGTEVAGNSGVPSVVAAGLDLPGVRELRQLEPDRLFVLAIAGMAVLGAAVTVLSGRRRPRS